MRFVLLFLFPEGQEEALLIPAAESFTSLLLTI